MTMGKPWLKLWTETLHDKKLRRTSPVTRWIWIALLMLAAETDDSGKMEVAAGEPMNDDDFREAAAVELPAWVEARDYFLRLGMMRRDGGTYVLTNYVKRQAPTDPTNAQRQARYRESKVAQGLAAGVPLVHASGEMAEAWREAIGVEPTLGLVRSMQAAEKKYGLEEVLAAIEITGKAGKATWGYTAGVLKNRVNGEWKPNGHAKADDEDDAAADLVGIDLSQFHHETTEAERAILYGGFIRP